MKKWYVGLNDCRRFAFSSETEPTANTHGDKYNAVIGPFKTKRACLWAANQSQGNPHFCHVRDAERISKDILAALDAAFI